LFILPGQPSAALEGNGKGRILSKAKGNCAKGKSIIAEIEFQNFL